MGAVNYKTAKWVTLAFPFVDTDDYLDDDGNVDFDAWRDDEQEGFNNISALLDQYSFDCLCVQVVHGYYEGCSVNIEMNYNILDDEDERKAVLDELAHLQHFLLECTNNGMRVCHPGWCTSFKDYANSRNAIRHAIRDAREEVRKMPIWKGDNENV